MADPTVPRERRPARPKFRRHETQVVVRPIRLSSTERIEPGVRLDSTKFRRHHLRALHRRRRIGPMGHPWTEFMLDSWEDMLDAEDERLETLADGMFRVVAGGKVEDVRGREAAEARFLELLGLEDDGVEDDEE